jgi:putative (di)nucleoside polyphosphate hydrolase
MEKYRTGVMAVIINEQKEVLVGQRSDHPEIWQFPQGGLEVDETLEQAFFREVKEELGNNQCEILKKADSTTNYKWPRGGRDQVVGQEHHWFLARYINGASPSLAESDHCFITWKWVTPEEALTLNYEWKRPALQKGLQALGVI